MIAENETARIEAFSDGVVAIAATLLILEVKVPFAGLAARQGDAGGWLPYVQVDDVDASTRKAVELGAALIKEKTRGPAGEFSVVRDPGGAAIALWQKA